MVRSTPARQAIRALGWLAFRRTQLLACLAAATVAPSSASAMTVLSNTASLGSGEVKWGGTTLVQELKFTVDQDVYGDYTSVWMEYEFIDSTLEVVNWNLDDESDWYIVQPGEVFSASGIAAGQYPVLFTQDNPRPPVPIDFAAGDTDDFFT